ncbi:30S ribosomal protein S20 [Hydrogenibacillus schlegelii]|uniref:Small ribosomal subunit protein bS20 n=2 Tax=Hydrogenibacillus schlegelii TaxID=1484 RepID=A0A2T5GDZ0_HYDSH|nr:30S ribosomal protein S20 [Hydrogenibacillus schlegelii]PTQ54403.1 MAG: SSU ribosomal protein S20p [Hydrogenibacillus schlegelii]
MNTRMANTKSAIKRIKKNEKRRLRNLAIRKTVRIAVKRVERALKGQSVEEALAQYNEAAKALEKAASKGAIHRNKAARKKSRLMKKINELKKALAATGGSEGAENNA